jgi:hypothetical protein
MTSELVARQGQHDGRILLKQLVQQPTAIGIAAHGRREVMPKDRHEERGSVRPEQFRGFPHLGFVQTRDEYLSKSGCNP